MKQWVVAFGLLLVLTAVAAPRPRTDASQRGGRVRCSAALRVGSRRRGTAVLLSPVLLSAAGGHRRTPALSGSPAVRGSCGRGADVGPPPSSSPPSLRF